MFKHLQIYDARERLIVGSADLILKVGSPVLRLLSRRRTSNAPERILLLRLERIGDLLMTLGAIERVRARAPGAMIHLVVGSWNGSLARLIAGVDSHETLDVPWLARQSAGATARALAHTAWGWRATGFDLALNFEPDIRSNFLMALSGAARRVGFSSGGGGSLLTEGLTYATDAHAASNAIRLVDAALPAPAKAAAAVLARLPVGDKAREEARSLLDRLHGDRLLVGVHASGGRRIKQWHLDRFAAVATRLSREHRATIVVTGSLDDRPLVDRIIALLPEDVKALDLARAMDLAVFAGLLEQLDLFVTCDTGPMHLAAAVGTPVVALFGPSDPARYGPLSDRARVVTADLWCRPCNRVRRPPARCTGHVPDCLNAIGVEAVYQAACELLKDASA